MKKIIIISMILITMISCEKMEPYNANCDERIESYDVTENGYGGWNGYVQTYNSRTYILSNYTYTNGYEPYAGMCYP